MNVFAYRQPTAKTATKPEAPGMEWASADVQVCVKTITGNPPYVHTIPWQLVYADGVQARPSNITYQQFDAPGCPAGDRTLLAGRCIRGWITFVAPAGKRATMIEYQGPSDGAVFDWAVS